MRLAEELGGSGSSGDLSSKRLGVAQRHDWRMGGQVGKLLIGWCCDWVLK